MWLLCNASTFRHHPTCLLKKECTSIVYLRSISHLIDLFFAPLRQPFIIHTHQRAHHARFVLSSYQINPYRPIPLYGLGEQHFNLSTHRPQSAKEWDERLALWGIVGDNPINEHQRGQIECHSPDKQKPRSTPNSASRYLQSFAIGQIRKRMARHGSASPGLKPTHFASTPRRCTTTSSPRVVEIRA